MPRIVLVGGCILDLSFTNHCLERGENKITSQIHGNYNYGENGL